MPNTDVAEPKYLDAYQAAQVLATCWIDADFLDQVELNPCAAIRQRFPQFDFNRLIHIPHNPGFTEEQLRDVLSAKIPLLTDPSILTHWGSNAGGQADIRIGHVPAYPGPTGIRLEYASLLQWSHLLARAWLDQIRRVPAPESFFHQLEADPYEAVAYARRMATNPEGEEAATWLVFRTEFFDFQRVIMTNPPPSILESGYSASLIKQIADGERAALVMPSGYST